MSRLRLLLSAFLLSVALPAFAAEAATSEVTLRLDQPGATINRNIYGHFAEHLGRCIYEGFWVGENSSIPNTKGIRNDVVAALRALDIPVLRWPGGCFADEYHWRDGIGPREKRPAMINTHWGGVVENNHFGTHEFFELCEQLGAEPYVCGNVGSGTVQEMMEWVEYMTSDADSPIANLRRQNGRDKPWKLTYFGVGNENWGCGGNMRAEYYSDNYRRFNTYVKNYGDQKIQRIAGGASGDDYHWTEVMMSTAAKQMQGLSLHYYTLPRGSWTGPKGSATQFDEAEYLATLVGAAKMDELVTKHSVVMDKHDPERKVGLVVDEWGIWTDPEPGSTPGFLYQQNSLRDAFVASLHLNVFHKHAARVTMANIAQVVNVLQAMILTDKEKMLLTPTYHVFEMYKVHQDARLLPLEIKSPDYTVGDRTLPAVSATASVNKAGKVHVAFTNIDPNREIRITCRLQGKAGEKVSARVLTGPAIQSVNTFAAPNTVAPKAFTAFQRTGDDLTITLPSKSIVALAIE